MIDRKSASSSAGRGIRPDLSRIRILLVEDHADTRNCLQMYLEMKGYLVGSAGSVAEAKAAFASFHPTVVISDLSLPDGNGWDLLGEMDPDHQLCSIAVSGFGSQADQTKSQAAGFSHHITKPFVPEELDAILGSL